MGVGSALLGGAGPLFMSRGPPHFSSRGGQGGDEEEQPPLGLNPLFFPPMGEGTSPGLPARGDPPIKAPPLEGRK